MSRVYLLSNSVVSIYSWSLGELLYGGERAVYEDKAYADEGKKMEYKAHGVEWCINRKAKRGYPLSEEDQEWNHTQNLLRAKGEHAFLIVKYLWSYRKVRYRGLSKNAAQVFGLFALANLYLVRKELMMMRA